MDKISSALSQSLQALEEGGRASDKQHIVEIAIQEDTERAFERD